MNKFTENLQNNINIENTVKQHNMANKRLQDCDNPFGIIRLYIDYIGSYLIMSNEVSTSSLASSRLLSEPL